MNVLNMLLLTYEIICLSEKTDINIGWDDTGQKTDSYNSVVLAWGENEHKIETRAIGYVLMYSKAANGILETIISLLENIDFYIRWWYDNRHILHGLNVVLNFSKIIDRIKTAQTDRVSTNYCVYKLLQEKQLCLVTHASCLRHDLNNGVIKFIQAQKKEVKIY